MYLNLSVVISYICCSKTVLGMDCCKTERFILQKIIEFFFIFCGCHVYVLYFFFIHSLNLKRILHPKAAFSAVFFNTYERFSPQQLLKSRSIF